MNVLRYAPLPLRPARFAALQAALGCHDLVVTEAHPASPDVIMAAIASSHPAVVVLGCISCVVSRISSRTIFGVSGGWCRRTAWPPHVMWFGRTRM